MDRYRWNPYDKTSNNAAKVGALESMSVSTSSSGSQQGGGAHRASSSGSRSSNRSNRSRVSSQLGSPQLGSSLTTTTTPQIRVGNLALQPTPQPLGVLQQPQYQPQHQHSSSSSFGSNQGTPQGGSLQPMIGFAPVQQFPPATGPGGEVPSPMNSSISVGSNASNSSTPNPQIAQTPREDSSGVAWVRYIRSSQSNEVATRLVTNARPMLQVAMLESVFEDFLQLQSGPNLQALPHPGAASAAAAAMASSDARQSFYSLCMRDRGNVLFPLMESWKFWNAPQNRQPDTPVTRDYFDVCMSAIEHHWNEMSTHQIGSIAFAKLFPLFPSVPYQQRFARLVLNAPGAVTTLTLHQYGNFLVTEVLKVAKQQPASFTFVFDQIAAEWAESQVFTVLCESRFGSHVLEAFLKCAPATYLLQLCGPLILTPGGVEVLVKAACHKQGNYPVQAVIRALFRSSGGPGPANCPNALVPIGQPVVPCICFHCPVTAPQLAQLLKVAEEQLTPQLESLSNCQYTRNILRCFKS